MEKVGKDGVITVEEAKSMDTSLDIVEGNSSTVRICHRILSLTPSVWKPTCKMPTSCCTKKISNMRPLAYP